jgi:pimeloyl-ACP methyl ester carboxylesterase
MVRLLAGLGAGLPVIARAIEEDSDVSNPAEGAVESSGTMTLGGRQFWGDVHFSCGFKIQRNVFFGHYRLLDSEDHRFASGTLAECRAMLEALRTQRSLRPEKGHVVLLIHGIGRSSKSLAPIRDTLRKGEFTPLSFEYPSTRVPLTQAAVYLQSSIESLAEAERISFVVHSMGGLVVRTLLKTFRDPRFHRMVMMGTPNRGAELADMLKKNFLYRTIYGPAGQELVTGPEGVISSLPVPDFEFGIVAGGCNNDTGYNHLLPGDNDGTVTVASARLPGARDFLLVPRLHSFLMSDPAVIDGVARFLSTGQFQEQPR